MYLDFFLPMKRVTRVPDPDPHQFRKLDPYPHQSGKQDPDPHQSGNLDPDPHQSEQDPDRFKVKSWKL
jgi:hypothetical protein